MMKKLLKSKWFRHGAFSLAACAVFIAAVVLINVIASVLVSHFGWKIYLTSTQAYEISDQTKTFLQNYDQPAEIIVLEDEATYRTQSDYTLQAYNILQNMASQNAKLSLRFVDLQENPGFSSQYADVNLSTGGVLVTNSQGNYRYISPGSLFSASASSVSRQTIFVSNVEQTVAHALEYISGQNPVVTAVISGHNETDISSVQSVIEANDYTLQTVNLITDNLPENTGLVLINSPTVDYTQEDIAKLSDYLNNGGALAYFASSGQPALPNLEALLAQYGVTFSAGTVVETNPNNIAYNSGVTFYTFAEANDYTSDMSDQTLPIAVAKMRPMQAAAADNVTTTNICSTSETCAVWPSNQQDYDVNAAEKQSFPIALGSKKDLGDGKTAQVTAFASLEMLGPIDAPTYGNGSFILSVLGETANHKSAVTVLPKSLESAPLGINGTQLILIAIVFIGAIPIAACIVGIIVCMRRKRR